MANVWRPLVMPDDHALHVRDDVELFHTPGGRTWYRWRSAQETAEMRILMREHHPTPERLRNALTVNE